MGGRSYILPHQYQLRSVTDKMLCVIVVNRRRRRFGVTVKVYDVPKTRQESSEFLRNHAKFTTFSALHVLHHITNRKSLPSIHLDSSELVPYAHFTSNVGILGGFYLQMLRAHLDCNYEELWMDATKGVICRGPEEPSGGRPHPRTYHNIESPLPSTPDLLQEDVLLRYLASLKSKDIDRKLTISLSRGCQVGASPDQVHMPTVISTLSNAPIATSNIATQVWDNQTDILTEQDASEHGLTRFTLSREPSDGHALWLMTDEDVCAAWLSQAASVFRGRGTSSDVDLSMHKLVLPRAGLDLKGYLSDSEAEAERRSKQPLYFFVRSPPPGLPSRETSSLHYWSKHEDSLKARLSFDECRNLGLPTTLGLENNGTNSFSWPTEIYQLLYQYQLLRGFEPKTTDFARHLGYSKCIFEVVNDSDRFQEV
ncbi:hypothetical protein PM082_004505 [Marasmius tenuissimus]|nr:hypothetical protein PM082_004505 [Marasmius tenuissimus]